MNLGFRSARHTRLGTWMIQSLAVTLFNHACDKDIQAIFEEVKFYISKVALQLKG